MNKILTAIAGLAIATSLVSCGSPESSEVETTTTTVSNTTTVSSSSTATTTSSSSTPTSTAVVEEPTSEVAPPTVAETPASVEAPQPPPFMDPTDFDPYGPPRFVECWEANAAVMSDGSIVTDTVNCAPQLPAVDPWQELEDAEARRTDGCVGPAAVCGYYDESGNPIWFDKETGETSPRYYDEYGNPTMDPQ